MSPEGITGVDKYMAEFGIAPNIARRYITQTFGVSPEELAESNLEAHKDVALIRIALGNEPLYLLEDVYAEVRAETLEREKKRSRTGPGVLLAVYDGNSTSGCKKA